MRQLRFAALAEIEAREPAIRTNIGKAIDAEKAGLQVELDARPNFDLPADHQAAFHTDPDFAAIDTIACHRDPCGPSLSRSSHTARSRASGENLFAVFLMRRHPNQEL